MLSNRVQEGLFSISAVSEQTGVNPVTLRAWERRYGLIQPARSESGRRLYTQQDVALIKEVLELLGQGVAVSRVKEALALAERDRVEGDGVKSPLVAYQQRMLEGVSGFDEALLESTYNEALSLFSADLVTTELFLPVFEALGARWNNNPIGVAEEHFFSVFIRNKLGARFHHRNLQNEGPRLVAACLPGEQHEFGLLLFSLMAHARGYRIVLLGANVPLLQLPGVADRTNADAIILSGSVPVDDGDLEMALQELSTVTRVPVFAGGSYAQLMRDQLVKKGIYPLGDDLVAGVHGLGQQLKRLSRRKR